MPPATGDLSAMPPATGDLSSMLPTSVAALNVRPAEGGGLDDVRPEGVGGPDDVRHEGVGGPDDTHHVGVGNSDDSVPSLHVYVRNIAATEDLSPIVANAKVLNLTFGRADLQPDPDIEMDTLLAHNTKTRTKGEIVRDPHRQFRCIQNNDLVYSSQHGRYKCSRRKCANLEDVPNNCLFHPQWLLPNGFKFCGPQGKAAFCPCLHKYAISPIIIVIYLIFFLFETKRKWREKKS